VRGTAPKNFRKLNVMLYAGFLRSLEKYGKVGKFFLPFSSLEKSGKNFFVLLVWKKKIIF